MDIQLLLLTGVLLFALNIGIAFLIRKTIIHKIKPQIEKEKLLHTLQLQEKLYQTSVLYFLQLFHSWDINWANNFHS